MIRINLLGHEASKQKRRSLPEFKIGGSDNAPFILAVVATLAIIGATWWWQRSNLAVLNVRNAEVLAEQQQLAETAIRVGELEDRRVVVNQKLNVIVELKKSQSGPVLLLDQISKELSDSLWLSDMVLSEGNVSLVGNGLSQLAVSDFARNLRLSSFFADTVLDYAQDTGDSVRFQISTRFVPLSIPEPELPVDEGAAPANGR
jgi:Tfp pilus assembly protein PilN